MWLPSQVSLACSCCLLTLGHWLSSQAMQRNSSSSSAPLHCFTDSFINATDSKWPERLSTVLSTGDEMVTALASSCFHLWKVWPVLGEHNNVTLGWGRAKGDPAVPRKGTCRRSRFCPGGRDIYLEPCKVRRRWRGLRKGRHKCV